MLVSAFDEYLRLLYYLFSPYTRLLQSDGGPREPDATTDDGCFYPEGAYYYVETVDDQQVPGRRPCRFDRCCFCAYLLKASLFNLCLYSDIVASADSCVSSYVFEPLRPLACNIKLVLF